MLGGVIGIAGVLLPWANDAGFATSHSRRA